MKIRFQFFFSIFVFSLAQAATNNPAVVKTSGSSDSESAFQLLEKNNFPQSRQWRKLLHFERTRLGFLRSQADGRDFFVSPEGAKDLAIKQLLLFFIRVTTSVAAFPRVFLRSPKLTRVSKK